MVVNYRWVTSNTRKRPEGKKLLLLLIKVEADHGFSKWFFFGGDSTINTNDPEKMEKIIKYNHLVANAVIFQNVVDLTEILQ